MRIGNVQRYGGVCARGSEGVETKDPLLWGIFFWNNAISPKLLCMIRIQTKQRSLNDGKVNIYELSVNMHAPFHIPFV